MNRVYVSQFKNQKLLVNLNLWLIFKYKIALNLTNYRTNNYKLIEIICLLNNQRGDNGTTNYLKSLMWYIRVELLNRFKILDESLVEDKTTISTSLKISYCLRSLINSGRRIVIALYKTEKGEVATLPKESIPSITEVYE